MMKHLRLQNPTSFMPFQLVMNYIGRQTVLQSVNVFSIAHKTFLAQEKAPGTLSKPYDLVPITELYEDLMKDAASPVKTDIDILISTIFKEKILVRKLNAYTNYSGIQSLLKEVTSLKYGRFTLEEDDVISRSWENLISKSGIEVNDELFKTIFGAHAQGKWGGGGILKGLSIDEKRKKGIVGCFLGQHLKSPRHCIDVLERASYIVQPFEVGKYTKEDNELILKEVKRSGDKVSTWRELSQKLDRDPRRWYNVRDHYQYEIKQQSKTSGKFSLQEDQIIIEKLFMGNECSLETVRNSKIVKAEGIPEVHRKGQIVYSHWKVVIQPILMSYHLGMLQSNWKTDFLTYIVEKGIHYKKEIDWSEACKLFPGQTVASLRKALDQYENSKELPLYKAIKGHQRKNADDYSEEQKLYRETIVEIYLDACKR